MRHIAILVYCFLLSSYGKAQVYVLEKKFKNHLQAENLSGNVKTVKHIHYKSAQFEKDSTLNAVIDYYKSNSYNKSGNLIESKLVRGDGSVARTESYFYNDKQQLTKHVGKVPERKAGEEEIMSFKYDNSGNKTEEILSLGNMDMAILKRVFKHDKQNRMIEMLLVSPLDNRTDKRTYHYNSRNQLLRSTQTTNSGVSISLYTYSTNAITTRIWSHVKNQKKDTVPTIHIAKCDKEQNLISFRTPSDKEDVVIESFYNYDAHKSWIRKLYVYPANGSTAKPSLSEERIITYH